MDLASLHTNEDDSMMSTQRFLLIKICHPSKNSKTHNMKGRRKKQSNPKHKNKRDCIKPKPEEKKSHEGMGRTTIQIKEGKGREETQTITTRQNRERMDKEHHQQQRRARIVKKHIL